MLADAVSAAWNVRGLPEPKAQVPQVDEVTLQTETGLLPGRFYGPEKSGTPVPMILYFHGGGWVIGGLDAFDSSARALADRTGAAVLSVHYRQAPEYPFPAAHDDALAAYRWLLASARDLGGDPGRIALAGEGAGGNLALAAAVAARDAGLPRPLHVLLITPFASTNPATASMQENAAAQPLSRADAAWLVRQYAQAPGDVVDPRLDLVRADLGRLPPTTVLLAQQDPLRSGGEELAARLEAAGTPVSMRVYPGLTHQFFVTGSLVPDAAAAQGYAADQLRQAFAAAPAAAAPRAPGARPMSRRRR